MATSDITIEDLKRQVDALDTNFIIIASILGAACAVLLILVIGAFVWLVSISKNMQNGSETFKIMRPKLKTSTPLYDAPTTAFDKRLSTNDSSRNTFDNPNFTRNPLSNNTSGPYFTSDMNINPTRSTKIPSQPFDNANFSFGPQYTSNSSFKTPAPDYSRDSKFY